MLTVDNLSKSFGKKTVLDNISVQLMHGVYGLLGPNGSGKTTFMRCIAGIYRYNGRIITPSNVGYLPQKFGAFRELTVYEVLEYFAELKGIPSNRQGKNIHDCLEDVNLWERHSDKVKTLSGGMLRRLGVAQALLGNPELILVDEPTAGLDPEERLRFKNLISQHREDCTILISTHIVEDVEALCDHIIILSHGKSICQDTPENIRKAAMKHVWHVSEKRQKELTSPYFILRREQIDGEAYLRVLSNEEQPGKSIQPTLEDGYINIISTGLFSIVGLVIRSFAVDFFLEDMNTYKSFTIITDKPDAIYDYITNTLHRGATIYNAEGLFEHTNKTIILTAQSKKQGVKLQEIIKQTDPHAFVLITNTSEIIGKGFRGGN